MSRARECAAAIYFAVLMMLPQLASADVIERLHFSSATYDPTHIVTIENRSSYAYALQQVLEAGIISEVRVTQGESVRVVTRGGLSAVVDALPLPVLVGAWVWGSSPKMVGVEIDMLVREPGKALYPVTIRHDLGTTLDITMGKPHQLACSEREVATLSVEPEAKRLRVRSFLSADRPWTKREVCLIGDGVELLSAREQAVLSELDLVRQSVAKGEMVKADEGHRHGAHFVLDSDAKGMVSIRIYDLAFGRRLTKFVGSLHQPRDYSAHVFLHEVGHALSMWRKARRYVEHERLVAEYGGVKASYGQAYESYEEAHRRLKARTQRYNELNQGYRVAWETYNGAIDHYNALVDAVKADQAGGAKSSVTQKELDGAQKKIEETEGALKVAEAARDKADEPMAALQASVNEAKRVADERGARMKALQAEIEKATIDEPSPLLTAYQALLGKDDWPTLYGRTSIDESFAESFAIFKTDPEALKRVLPRVFDWFEAGKHEAYLPEPPRVHGTP